MDRLPVTLESLLADGVSRKFEKWLRDNLEIALDSYLAITPPNSRPRVCLLVPMGKGWAVIGESRDLEGAMWYDAGTIDGFSEGRLLTFHLSDQSVMCTFPVNRWLANKPFGEL